MKAPGPLDAVANISVTLYGNGEMSISGNIGDVRLALQMLDHARDAVNNQWSRRDSEGLLLPPSDVDVSAHDAFPLTQYADTDGDVQRRLVRETLGGVR